MPDIIDKLLVPLALAGGQLWLAALFKRWEARDAEKQAKTEEKRKAEAEWREAVEKRLADTDEKLNAVLKGQLTQMRSDLVHKAHRYIDDLGCASTDEKNAFDAEYTDYCAICKAHGIKNNFVDSLHSQVMNLPARN